MVRRGGGSSSGGASRAIGAGYWRMASSRTAVKRAVLSAASASASPVEARASLGVEVEDVLAFGFFPEQEAGEDGGAGLERDAGEAGGGAGFDAEEGDEEALRRRHVGVHEDADGLAGAHGGEQAAGEVVLVQDAVAVLAADAVYERVDQRVVEAADDHAHGVAGERVVEAGELPCAEMAGEDEDAFAAGAGGEVVLEAFVADEARGGVGGVGGHLAELGEQPAEVAVFEAEDAGRARRRAIGKASSRLRRPTRRRRPRSA